MFGMRSNHTSLVTIKLCVQSDFFSRQHAYIVIFISFMLFSYFITVHTLVSVNIWTKITIFVVWLLHTTTEVQAFSFNARRRPPLSQTTSTRTRGFLNMEIFHFRFLKNPIHMHLVFICGRRLIFVHI